MTRIVSRNVLRDLKAGKVENLTIGRRSDLYKAAWDQGYRVGMESAQPKWISVEERLPEESETVLVYRDGCCGVARLLDVEPEIMWTYTGFGGDPTHWMPLPEPPKEEK
ncbi:MAG: DUF551 domain-containing protein [Clostridia bacterium]|nr:DUF551 domain-containing protein [Clostridia bacterium]